MGELPLIASGMMGRMSLLDAALGAHRVVIEFPRTGVEDWVALAEVLLQEGLGAWALPPDLLATAPEVVALYGFRARVGACGVTDAAAVRAAVDAGVHFILAPTTSPEMVEAAGEVPFVGGALTPNEVAGVVRGGADTVLVTPADALGTAYARTLPPMFPGVALVPSGRLERYQCEMWLAAGAAGVVVSDVVLRPEDDAGLNTADEVGRRAAGFGTLARRLQG